MSIRKRDRRFAWLPSDIDVEPPRELHPPERMEVDGRMASVVFMDEDGRRTTVKGATQLWARFDDGSYIVASVDE